MGLLTGTCEAGPNRCPRCGAKVQLETARFSAEFVCPHCGARLEPAGGSRPQPEPTAAWGYGQELMEQGRVEAAIAVFQSVVARVPERLCYRRSLRELERRLRDRDAPPDPLAMTAVSEALLAINRAKRKTAHEVIDWDEIDRVAEQGLAVDPWDVELNFELGHACRARGYREVALFAYRCALESAPDREDIEQRLHDLVPGWDTLETS